MKVSELLESLKRSKDGQNFLVRLKVWSTMKMRRIFNLDQTLNNTVEMGTLTDLPYNQTQEEEIRNLKENIQTNEKKLHDYKTQTEKDMEFYKTQANGHIDDSTEKSILNVIDEFIDAIESSRLLNESFFNVESLKFERIFRIIEDLRTAIDCQMEDQSKKLILDLMVATKLEQSDKLIQDTEKVFFESRRTLNQFFCYKLKEISESLVNQRDKMDKTERKAYISAQKILTAARNTRRKTSKLFDEKMASYEQIF